MLTLQKKNIALLLRRNQYQVEDISFLKIRLKVKINIQIYLCILLNVNRIILIILPGYIVIYKSMVVAIYI